MRSVAAGVRRAASAALAILIASLPACARAQARATAPAPARVDTAALRRTLDSLATRHHGVVGYAVRDLDGGAHLSLRGTEPFPTASLIKVAVLVTLYDMVEHNELALTDPVSLVASDRVPGSGALQFLHPGLVLSLRDAAQLMVMLSDNAATNLVLQKVGIRRVWAKMDSLGLHDTRIFAEVYKRATTSVAPDSSKKYGLGKTTPEEMTQLFALLAAGRAVSAPADSAMLAMLETNDNGQMLQRYLENVRAAHKDGEDDDIRTECTLWYLRTRVVACVLTKDNQDQRWVMDNEPQLLMARMGAAIVAAFGVPDKAHVALP